MVSKSKAMNLSFLVLILVLVERTVFSINVGLIKTVNYNLEKLNPLRDYTTIMLDLPREPKPKRKRPLPKSKKKRQQPQPNQQTVKNEYHRPLVIGDRPKIKHMKPKHVNKRPKYRHNDPSNGARPRPTPSIKSTLQVPVKRQVSELIDQINKEITNLMEINQAATNIPPEENYSENDIKKEDKLTEKIKQESFLPTNKKVKKNSATFSSLLDLGKQLSNQYLNVNEDKNDGLHVILADFMEEFKLSKTELKEALTNVSNMADSNHPEDILTDTGYAAEIINLFIEDYTRIMESEAIKDKKTEDSLNLQLEGKNKILKPNQLKSEKDLFVEAFF